MLYLSYTKRVSKMASNSVRKIYNWFGVRGCCFLALTMAVIRIIWVRLILPKFTMVTSTMEILHSLPDVFTHIRIVLILAELARRLIFLREILSAIERDVSASRIYAWIRNISGIKSRYVRTFIPERRMIIVRCKLLILHVSGLIKLGIRFLLIKWFVRGSSKV